MECVVCGKNLKKPKQEDGFWVCGICYDFLEKKYGKDVSRCIIEHFQNSKRCSQ